MGNFAPVAAAFALNSNGLYIFREGINSGCDSPFVAGFIFLFSVFLLLWEIKLYPSSLRKPWRWGKILLEFFSSLFVMEHLVSDFWSPLDAATQATIPKIADGAIEVMNNMGFGCSPVVELLDNLRCEEAATLGSYALSTFFLGIVLHATRIVDFRLLRCGVKPFLKEPLKRLRTLKRKIMRSLGLRKRVEFEGCKSKCPRPRRSKKCDDDSDEYSDAEF